jgi:acyl-CoA synthetase (AMP-forming)/AMP-acid ligase II
MVTGAERVNPATLKRFNYRYRFARFSLSETVIRASYGLADATLYVATAGPGRPPKTSAISRSRRARVADVVVVALGSIPVTTSGKVRRSACVERYLNHEFTGLNVRT